MAYRITIVECADCGHKWVEMAGERDRCFLCDGRNIRRPLFVGQVREVYRSLSPDAPDYAARRPIIEKLYFESTPLVLDRAKEVFGKASHIYGTGDRSDRVMSRLIFCFFVFEELGLHDSAVSCGNLIALGYLQRGESQEVTREEDLADLGRAIQWFALLDAPEWLATVNTRIGMSASHAVTADTRQYRRLLQIAHKHLDMARLFYAERNFPMLREHIDRELEHVVRIQAGAVVGSGYIEGAEIQAEAIREMGRAVSSAIEAAGQYIGLSIAEAGAAVAGAVQAQGQTIAGAISTQGQALAGAIADHGVRVQQGLGGVAGAVGVGLGSLSQSVRLGLGQVSRTMVRLGDKTSEGLENLGLEVRGGLVQASENLRKEMGTLGNKVALGMIGGGAIGGLLAGGAIHQLGEGVSRSLGEASSVMATATGSLADATRQAGELQADPRSVLIRDGFDAARRLLPGAR